MEIGGFGFAIRPYANPTVLPKRTVSGLKMDLG